MNPILQAATTAATVKAVTSDRGPRTVERKENPKTLQEAFLARPLAWLIVGGVAIFIVSKTIGNVRDEIKARRDEKERQRHLMIRRSNCVVKGRYQVTMNISMAFMQTHWQRH